MADKYIKGTPVGDRFPLVEGVVVSGGAADAGKLVALNGVGRLDTSVLPSSSQVITASEALAAYDWVNIYNDTGAGNVLRVRKANASLAAGAPPADGAVRPAHGFVLSIFGAGASALVYTSGINPAATRTGGFVAADRGKQLWLTTTAGLGDYVPPSSYTAGASHTGNSIIQAVGWVTDVAAPTASVLFTASKFAEKHSVYNAGPVNHGGVGTTVAATVILTPWLSGVYSITGTSEIVRNTGAASALTFTGTETGTATVFHTVGASIGLTSTFCFRARMSLTAGTTYTFVIQMAGAGTGSASRNHLTVERAA